MILTILFIIALYWLTGFCLLQILRISKHLNICERIGSSYILGVGIVSFTLFLLSWAGISWNKTVVTLPFLFFIVLSVLLIKRKRIFRFYLNLPKTRLSKVLTILLFATCAFVVFESVLRPVSAWDVWTSWYMGGKAFFVDRGIAPDFYRYVNHDYPPLQFILIAHVFTILGQVEDRITLLVFAAFYISLLTTFYGFLRRYTGMTTALFFTFLLASTQNLIRHAGRFEAGHADLTLACFFFTSVVFLMIFLRSKSVTVLILLQFLLGAGALVKNEGITFLIIVDVILLYNFIRWNKHRMMFYLLVAGVMLTAWQLFKIQNNVIGSYLSSGSLQLARVPNIILEALREFVNIPRWHVVWVTAGISLFFLGKNRDSIILSLLWIGQLLVYLAIYLMTPLDPVLQLRNSFDRLLLHILPITTASLAITVCNIKDIAVLLKKYD